MNLLELRLHQFRSYHQAAFHFDPGTIHILEGANAQGKTNVIEAISYVSNLRSFRTRNVRDLIEHSASGFSIDAICESQGRRENLRIHHEDGKKKLFRYGNPVPSFSQFVGTLNAVLFSPDDMMFFTGAPALRRRFLDTELVKLSSAYTEALRSCQKLLKERNALLKRRQFDQLLLDTYTDGLIAQQQTVVQQRQRFVMHLNRKLKKLYPVFSKGEETLEIQYKTFADPEKDTGRQMKIIYEKNLDRDRRFGATGDGIHKDDLVFLLDGYPMPAVSSQGQKRSALLALKLALCAIIKEKTGQYPVFLLDDVFSELDPDRRQKLIDLLPEDMQVFITAAEPVQADFKGRQVCVHHIRKKSKGKDGQHEPQ
ncbi:DNA replication/repair protein RecF [uncultured Faecalibaculum sp.]|uniref:DNA replication/repair protein RecF n=1 Tax=uncultured Faecalibaculum sp. TaxID=1729681 RepID=UPI0025CD7B44|nr:DNA replication and repair protein RecF [uncultured Faecalibaculum sp.]